jgi:hypothetical protein
MGDDRTHYRGVKPEDERRYVYLNDINDPKFWFGEYLW